jgi:Methyltransferase domain
VNKIITPIIDQIEQTVKDIPGWSPLDQLYTLFNLAYLTADLKGDIVEIGSWCGRSAVVLGMAAQQVGNTKVHCVDLFPAKDDWRRNADGTYSFVVEIDGVTYGAYQDQTVWAEPYERDILPLYEKHYSILEIFNQTIAKHQLQGVVVTHIGDSSRFVSSMPENFECKLAFLDGDHGYKALCRDINNLESFLVTGGWICFDDAFASYDSVNRAIEERIINNPAYDRCQQMTRKCFIARKT